MRISTISDRQLLFIDTWGWLALADAKEPAYKEAIRMRREHSARGPVFTTDYVLDETLTRLFKRHPFPMAEAFSNVVFEAEKEDELRIEPITRDRFDKACKMRLRYRDKPRISFTDLTSFVLMRELGIRHVLTGDRHFAEARLGFRILP